ncbi:hypothetical protein AB0N60_36575, partial [Streptomyces microflavus]
WRAGAEPPYAPPGPRTLQSRRRERAGAAAFVAAAGTTVSALSALNAAVALFLVLEAATTTPL